MPDTPIADKASRASSSLNGLMIAVINFMESSLDVLVVILGMPLRVRP
jgi:hypothetical protein